MDKLTTHTPLVGLLLSLTSVTEQHFLRMPRTPLPLGVKAAGGEEGTQFEALWHEYRPEWWNVAFHGERRGSEQASEQAAAANAPESTPSAQQLLARTLKPHEEDGSTWLELLGLVGGSGSQI